MKDLTQNQWNEQIKADKDAVILDVRTDEEVAEGYIPGAKQLDIYNAGAFMEKANLMDKSKNYYVYCRSGSRSAQACMILESIGFDTTYNLLGGFSEWEGDKTV
ncbi:rhodanese-like domain-containing protein [Constantimarinum furrinae]|uniref:Rhodanese-like domain protein n=1 Tax=Constantimarinum furrinae TaxID=2562285 RepID=A0A7G8PV36_9FLAO|nr:rhodanese-like domain-containing protein [Constantimarinum furrinae]QNJ98202.1 Rhodanese-like domain protein [Constantimarinum furrinae]